MKKIRLLVFLLTVIAGMIYPVYKIIKLEYPEQIPAVYRFRCGVVDPYDPFRGRYVTFRALPDRTPADGATYRYGENIYAVLGVDAAGTATVLRLSKTIPTSGDFIIVKYNRNGTAFDGNEATDRKERWHFFSFPFERFYLNEKHAPEAEKIVAKLSRDGSNKCVLRV